MSPPSTSETPSYRQPRLSVIVASVNSAHYLERFLGSLMPQTEERDVEVIVADFGDDDALSNARARYPQVAFLTFDERTSLPRLWGAGIKRSTGEIISIMDSTCPPDQKWVDRVLEAHRSPYAVIGGAVELDGLARPVDLAAYFCEYAQFMHPLIRGVVNELPGNNLSFKRWVIERGPEYLGEEFWKTFWCRRLQDEKIDLISDPSIVVYYTKSFHLIPFTIRRFHHGRCFAGMRVGRTPLWMRLMYAGGTMLLPAILLLRIVRMITFKRRNLGKFLISLHVSLVAIVSWSVGEFCGYICGPGGSCARVR